MKKTKPVGDSFGKGLSAFVLYIAQPALVFLPGIILLLLRAGKLVTVSTILSIASMPLLLLLLGIGL